MFPEYPGLSSAEVLKQKAKFGKNTLPTPAPPTRIQIFFSQFKNPFVYILLAATLVTFLISHYSDAAIILAAVLINSILGYVQEYRAGSALNALKNYLTSQVKVKRDHKLLSLESSELVPGDVVILDAGSRVPADGTALFVNRVSLNESILTGESRSITKAVKDEVYMGTIIVTGQLVMRVQHIGRDTKMGEIADRLGTDSPPTPLELQLKKLSHQILKVIAFLLALVITLGIIRQLPLSEIFLTAVALAVSSIPEGLIVSLTIILALGMQKILRYRGLVRRLSSAETLGGVTVICVDKTGTLTTGILSVVSTIGDKKNLAAQIQSSSDHDDPLVVAAYDWSKTIKFSSQKLLTNRLDTLPFESHRRFAATLHPNGSHHTLYVSGAPETILGALSPNSPRPADLRAKLASWTKAGKRVVAYATRTVPSNTQTLQEKEVLKNLTFAGLIAFDDPVRLSVAPALVQTKQAGIRLMVITGDYATTAQNVLASLGLNLTPNQIMLGDDFARLSAADRAGAVNNTLLFARTTPAQKLAIVEALKQNGEVVAMMGDGVNDAPSLHRADIGVVVGTATDVAKETADLVLLDSNFATIIRAIRQGRIIFNNLRKIILYLLSGAFAEILVVTFALFADLPLPLAAAQILWINIVSDGAPALALTIDPPHSRLMHEPPRRPTEPLLTLWMRYLIVLVSTLSALLAYAIYLYTLNTTQDYLLARSLAFLSLGFNSLTYVFSVRLLTIPFWKEALFANRLLLGAVAIGIGLQLLPFILSPLRAFFGVVALAPAYYFYTFASSLLLFLAVEIFKTILHKARS